MGRLIDKDALLAEYDRVHVGEPGNARKLIENAPTIEERKTGKWIPFDYPWYQCSECGAVRENKSFLENFCSNCGADMREQP